jgi:hypothetical protein
VVDWQELCACDAAGNEQLCRFVKTFAFSEGAADISCLVISENQHALTFGGPGLQKNLLHAHHHE